jgi:hypothetical protein
MNRPGYFRKGQRKCKKNEWSIERHWLQCVSFDALYFSPADVHEFHTVIHLTAFKNDKARLILYTYCSSTINYKLLTAHAMVAGAIPQVVKG